MPLCRLTLEEDRNLENSIKISEKEEIFGCQERNHDWYIIIVAIFNTKLDIYKRWLEGGGLNLKDVLRFIYTEMLNDEHVYEIKLKPDLFEMSRRKCKENLLTKFA